MQMNKTNNPAHRKIVRAALEAFLDGPYARVSVREIAQRAGYSHTYVHKMFGSKRSLFQEAAVDARSSMLEQACLLPEDNTQTIALKMLSTNPLHQPFVQLIRKSASDSEMLEALIETWDVNEPSAIGRLAKSISLKSEMSSPALNSETIGVWCITLIWSLSAVEILQQVLGGDDEQSRRIRAAPQMLLLDFISRIGDGEKQ